MTWRSSTRRPAPVLAAFALLGGCALQPAYERPVIAMPDAWANSVAPSTPAAGDERGDWWALLGDPGIDALVREGLRDNPTLTEAVARIDRARAVLGVSDARKLPALGVDAEAMWSRDRRVPSGGATGQTSAAIGARLSWELDVWGRVREGSITAQGRLAARTAEADGARLSVIGDIADTALALRACHGLLSIRDRDIASRETELDIGRARLAFGTVAPVVVAAAQGNLADARTERAVQEEACARLFDALLVLTGLQPDRLRAVLPPAPNGRGWLPEPPPFIPALPATVLLGNPGVVAAERELAARWSEIAVARAERLPRIDLAAALTGQWLRALGSGSSHTASSVGANLTAPLLDGGAGTANLHGAQAAYREAAAQLVSAVRSAVRDIEDGLAAQQSAALRIETTQAALASARFTLAANEARWRAGAIAQFELEESRRQFNRAEQQAVTAEADRARAWVALMRGTGRVTSNPAGAVATGDKAR